MTQIAKKLIIAVVFSASLATLFTLLVDKTGGVESQTEVVSHGVGLFPPEILAAEQSFLGKEAGIAVYSKIGWLEGADKNWNRIRGAMRTIEKETPNYVVGVLSMFDSPFPAEPHVYVNKSGWLVAYYLKPEPAARIFCWWSECGGSGSVTLATAIDEIAAVGVGTRGDLSYYDFRYPDATRVFAAVRLDSQPFTLMIPSELTVFERGVSSLGGTLKIDGEFISLRSDVDTISVNFLIPDVFHTISSGDNEYDRPVGLVIIGKD